MIEERVLFVDDDISMLDTYQRNLYEEINVEIAPGGQQGLDKIKTDGPFAVVVSDLRMPGMDGIEFLGHVRQISGDSVRMLLSGNVDLQAAIESVNEGHIFRLMTKPCSPEGLLKTLCAGVEQYRLVTAEKELMQKTFIGTIKVLTDILSLTDPEAFGRTVRMRADVRQIAATMQADKAWEIELAWMLSQIGLVAIPPEVALKKRTGQKLTREETEIVSSVPKIAEKLLGNIPRLEGITGIIAQSDRRYDGDGSPDTEFFGDRIPLGSRILKVVSDLAELEAKEFPRGDALHRMENRAGWYDPKVLSATAEVFNTARRNEAAKVPETSVQVFEMKVGDLLLDDVRTTDGCLLMPRGSALTALHLERIKNFYRLSGVVEPIRVQREAKPGRKLATYAS